VFTHIFVFYKLIVCVNLGTPPLKKLLIILVRHITKLLIFLVKRNMGMINIYQDFLREMQIKTQSNVQCYHQYAQIPATLINQKGS
jgi:hypothetical protein